MGSGLQVMDTLTTPPLLETPLVPPLPPIKPEYKQLCCPERGVVCYTQSLTAKSNDCLADVALFKGHSFRAGWGRDNTLLSLNTDAVAQKMVLSYTLDQLDKVLAGRQEPDTSPAIVQRIRILPGEGNTNSYNFQVMLKAAYSEFSYTRVINVACSVCL